MFGNSSTVATNVLVNEYSKNFGPQYDAGANIVVSQA